MSQYLLIMADEDGNSTNWLENKEVQNISQLMEDYGIRKFLTQLPADSDPNYWEDGWAMLLEVKIKTPKPVKVVEKWELE